MLYLIGGPSRTGKSTLAALVGDRLGLSVVSTDALVWALQQGAPSLGVRHGTHDDKAESLLPFLVPFVEASTNGDRGLVLEGDALRPRQAEVLRERFGARVCFLGNLSAQARDLTKDGGWATAQSEQVLAALAEWVAETSRVVEQGCEELGFPYFDVGDGGRDDGLRRAFAYLVDDRSERATNT